MKIIDLQLQFISSKLSIGNTPRFIGLHHSGGIGTIEGYHQLHQNNGWAGLGYNFFVDLDGSIFKGRPIEYVPAAILNHNYDSLHICANGNFETMVMPEVQREAIKELILYCNNIYPTIQGIYGHKDLMDTDCPGKNYPLEMMKNNLGKSLAQSTSSPIPSTAKSPFSIQNEVCKLQHILNVMGIADKAGNKLSEDGCIGPLTIEALSKIAVKRGDVGPIVGWIQEKLGISVDNIYGAYPWHETYDSIINFQRNNKLVVDGIVGVNTFIKLASQ